MRFFALVALAVSLGLSPAMKPDRSLDFYYAHSIPPAVSGCRPVRQMWVPPVYSKRLTYRVYRTGVRAVFEWYVSVPGHYAEY